MVSATPPILAVKRPFGFAPADAMSEDKIADIPLDTVVELKPKRSRSLKQLNLYWAVLAEVVSATDAWATARHLHDAILMDLGYRTVVQRLDGKKYWIPDSIAFSNMKQDEFNEYTDKAFARLAEVVGFDPLEAYEELRGANSNTQRPSSSRAQRQDGDEVVPPCPSPSAPNSIPGASFPHQAPALAGNPRVVASGPVTGGEGVSSSPSSPSISNVSKSPCLAHRAGGTNVPAVKATVPPATSYGEHRQ